MSVATEFRDFILRGNVVDLAVGVVIGASFGAVVKQFTADFITPLVGIAGTHNFGDIVYTVHGAKFAVGDFFNTIVTFLITAFVVFFCVVKPVNILMWGPGLTVQELADLGVRRISIGGALARVAWGAVMKAAEEIRTGRFDALAMGGPSKPLNEIFSAYR